MTSGSSRTVAVILVLALLGLLGAYAAHDYHDHAGEECRLSAAVHTEAAPTVTTPVLETPEPLLELTSPAPIDRPAPTFPLPWSARAPPRCVSIRI